MSRLRVIGVDPGGTTGLACLDLFRKSECQYPVWRGRAQSTEPRTVLELVNDWADIGDPVWIVAEAFIVNNRAGRSAHGGAGQKARDLLGALKLTDDGCLRQFRSFPAGLIKPFATNERLEACGYLDHGHTTRHAADAARAALFFAVDRLGWPDPLTRRKD